MGGLENRIGSVIAAAKLERGELAARVDRCAWQLRPPGLKNREDRDRFTACLAVAVADLARLASGQTVLSAISGPTSPFNPFGEIKRLARTDLKEATWLAFLATHVGWDRPDSCGLIYRGLGDGERWTWDAVSSDPGTGFSRWMDGSWQQLSRLAPFGNHRKYLTHRPSAPVSTRDTVRSFVEWTGAGDRRWAAGAGNPEAAFDQLYRSLDAVTGFGRTARYDFVRLLGLLELAEVWPGRCYLDRASGPRSGAARMFLGRGPEGVPAPWLEERCCDLARGLGVDLQAVEDAVCNWQKRGWRPPEVTLTDTRPEDEGAEAGSPDLRT